jgi:hypothetical protein
MTPLSYAKRRLGAARLSRITFLMALALLQSLSGASAERIKHKPPTEIEAARIASDQAMNDGMLRRGDVVVTDRGFSQVRGFAPDGNPDFVTVPNPLDPPRRAFDRHH